MRFAIAALTAILLMLTTGCSPSREGETRPAALKIAINPWVGYTPFFHLDRTGELEKLGFRLVMVSSLGENANLMSNHLVDGFAATQYEFLKFRDELEGVVPVFTVDLSAGADKIHSNVSIEQLKEAKEPIDVYMEFGSVNEDLFRAFVKAKGLEGKSFRFHHDPQSVIKSLNADPSIRVIVVSYEPFSSMLEKNGIHVVADSGNLEVFIVDALFTRIAKLRENRERFLKLKEAFWNTVALLEKDPVDFYETIKPYLEGQSYETFLQSLEGIRWLRDPDEALKKRLKAQGVDTEHLL